jgi:GT2 family glycosyltransferase
MTDLLISIVLYQPDINELVQTIKSLIVAVQQAVRQGVITSAKLVLVDNGIDEDDLPLIVEYCSHFEKIGQSFTTEFISGHGNVGFGKGHNLAANNSNSTFYLVLNPDVELDIDAIRQAVIFLQGHEDVGLLSPSVTGAKGEKLFLCKRYPTFFDLVLRGIGLSWPQRVFQKRLASYEMQDICSDEENWHDVPIVSGCFMFFRRSVWAKSHGFSRDFFVYFEDFDLSIRVADFSRIVYLPTIKITHLGGHAARKGLHHIKLFVNASRIFFNKNGWRLW